MLTFEHIFSTLDIRRLSICYFSYVNFILAVSFYSLLKLRNVVYTESCHIWLTLSFPFDFWLSIKGLSIINNNTLCHTICFMLWALYFNVNIYVNINSVIHFSSSSTIVIRFCQWCYILHFSFPLIIPDWKSLIWLKSLEMSSKYKFTVFSNRIQFFHNSIS